MSLLVDFKNAKIKNVIQRYNVDVALLVKYYNNLIRMTPRSITRSKVNKAINDIIADYNSKISVLISKMNTDIAIINEIVLPNTIENSNNSSALLIGINYVGTEYELGGCINDINDVSNLLTEYKFKNIKMLSDNTSQKPTKSVIVKEFTNLLSNANPGDTIFCHYSGHGTNIKDKNGDETSKYDSCIVDIDLNIITDDELKQIIDTNLKSDVTLIALFDSCFSGSVLDLRYEYMDSLYKDALTENANECETKGNVIMISGCSDIQKSADTVINGRGNGAMTTAFLETFKNNKDITWRQLLINMRDLLKKSDYLQTPQLASGTFFNIDSPVFI